MIETEILKNHLSPFPIIMACFSFLNGIHDIYNYLNTTSLLSNVIIVYDEFLWNLFDIQEIWV